MIIRDHVLSCLDIRRKKSRLEAGFHQGRLQHCKPGANGCETSLSKAAVVEGSVRGASVVRRMMVFPLRKSVSSMLLPINFRCRIGESLPSLKSTNARSVRHAGQTSQTSDPHTTHHQFLGTFHHMAASTLSVILWQS